MRWDGVTAFVTEGRGEVERLGRMSGICRVVLKADLE